MSAPCQTSPSLSLSGLIILCWLTLASLPAWGELVQLRQPSGIEATARLLEGADDRKVVMLLHGFLQTRDFFTIRRLGEALHDMGYTVLMPNLTLDIDNRNQSLACEAIHTHSLGQDATEIGRWVDWLHRRTGQPVTLIGHSAGSLELVAYLAGASAPPVDQAILVSLIGFAQGPIAKENETERQRALRQLKEGNEAIERYRLAFCDNYSTTAEDYLSYLEWNGNKTLKSLNILPIEPTILLGGEDHRLGDDWLPSLRQAGIEVIEVPGANHFFDHEYEFDLMDRVLELLQR